MEKRNIAVCIILSLVTCGIYGLVWFVQMTDDVANASDDHSISGGMALLLTIITCGLYQIYWAYKMGKLVAQAQENYGQSGNDNSTLYLILQIFGLGIVNYCLIQSDLNQLAD
jgi:hypothetical protein